MRMGVHYKLDDPSQGSPPPSTFLYLLRLVDDGAGNLRYLIDSRRYYKGRPTVAFT
jgi:hypothetical protein